jgi:DNA-binding transcriptional LysR family regulator
MDARMQLSDRIGRRMKLQDLHVLMAVVQAGSMSRAAQLLNTTQPAISRSIAELEHTIGARLLDRSRQGVEPTEYGRALLDGGTAMFDDLRQAVKNIEFIADPTVGEIRVGAHDPLIVGVLPAVFDRLHRKYPGISIHVLPISQNPQQYRDLRERKIDLLLGRITLPVQDDLHADILFHDAIKVVAGPKNRWTRHHKVELSELADEPWHLPAPDTLIGSLIAGVFRARGMKFPPKGVVFASASHMCAILPRGPYLGTLPASLLRFGVNLPRLKVLPVDLPIPPWPVGVMTLKNRTLTPVVRLFIDCAREVVKPLASKSQPLRTPHDISTTSAGRAPSPR